ncbi:lysosome-associated membrane glycoprotein 1 isoform 1-T1 [Erethizon dorsatum]
MAASRGARRPLLLLLLAGLTYGASAVFEVKDSNGTTCIMANFSAAFWTSYETERGSENVTFSLPHSAQVLNSSSCGGGNASEPRLAIAFGDGHSLTLQFTRNATRYHVQLLRFVYNLADTHTFPGASYKEVKTEDSMTDILADIDKKYRCVSATQVHMKNVTVTLSDTTIQAYLSNSTFSKGETRCKQDMPSPTSAPPAPPTPPSPSPSPTSPSPSTHRYNVSGDNGTCLLASMGLQLNITYPRKDNTTVTRVVNINPNATTAVGSCGASLVSLELRSEKSMVLVLRFGLNASANRFFLQEVQLNMTVPDARGPGFQGRRGQVWVCGGVSAGWEQHADPHCRGRRPGRARAHCAHCLPHRQEEESRWLPDDLERAAGVCRRHCRRGLSCPGRAWHGVEGGTLSGKPFSNLLTNVKFILQHLLCTKS